MGGATQIGAKRTFPIKLKNGLTSSRVQTTFAVHARLIVRADSTGFSCLWVGHRPMGTQNPRPEVSAYNRDFSPIELASAKATT
jgi:hypothetical protein